MSVVVAAIITGVCVIAAQAVSAWVQLRATGRVHVLAQETQHLVNSTAEAAQARNDQLVRQLVNSGTEVPLSASEERLHGDSKE